MEIKTKARAVRESKIKGEDAEDRKESEQEAKWRAEADAETLTRAEEIKADKARYSAARAIASDRAAALMKVLK